MSSPSSLGSDRSFTLPYYPARKVDFVNNPVISRLPRDDELYVIKAFARHARHCSTCAHPYDVHQRGHTLCSKGHQRALDVAQYLYNKRGETHSVVDRDGNRMVHVEIPRNCDVVRSLLKAIERGLRLRRKVQPVSYDETYYIPARTTTTTHRVRTDPASGYPRGPRYVRKPKLETAEPPPGYYSAQRRQDNLYYVDSESLYERNAREKERPERCRQPVYDRCRPPVPPKDDYWS